MHAILKGVPLISSFHVFLCYITFFDVLFVFVLGQMFVDPQTRYIIEFNALLGEMLRGCVRARCVCTTTL